MPYQQIDKEHYPQLYKNKRQRVVSPQSVQAGSRAHTSETSTGQRGSRKKRPQGH